MVSRKRALAGKVAIITGGGTGLGKAMALALSREGADIVVAARRLEPIEQTAREVSALGSRGLAIATDITDSRQVNRLVAQTLVEMGRIDILINNAAGGSGGGQRKPLWDITDEEWHLGMNTLTGPFFCCRAVGKHLVAQKSGKIINVASLAGLRSLRDQYIYGCAKAGVIQLTRTLAISWAPYNVQVNCILPGVIDTGSLQPQPQPRPRVAEGAKQDYIPVGRFGIPPDIGALGLFLASDAADYITGAMFAADGGGLAGGYAPTGYAPTITMEED